MKPLCAALLVLVILTACPPIVNGQGLFQVTLQAVDSQRHPLEREVRFVISGWGEARAPEGNDGIVIININGGNYHIDAYVLEVKVGETDTQVISDSTVTVQTRTYGLSVSVAGLPENMTGVDGIAKALIGTEIITSRFSQGQAVFGQLPEGSVSLTVFVGAKPVAAETVFLSADSQIVLQYAVFQQITLTVVDASGTALVGATVTIGGVSGTTDASGMVSLYSGGSEGMVVFRGITVFNSTISSNSTITARVADLSVPMLDVASQPLASTPLHVALDARVGSGSWSDTVMTDAQGNLVVSQLPYGNLTVSIPNGPSVKTLFPLPTATKYLLLVTATPKVEAQIVDAYMMGFMTIRVTVTIGKYRVNNATVSAPGLDPATTRDGVVVLRVPLGLEWTRTVNVTVRAYGTTSHKLVTANASPLLLLTSPLAFAPLIVWRVMVVRYKRRRTPLIEGDFRKR